MKEKYKIRFENYLKEKQFAIKCNNIIKIGFIYQERYSKMAKAKIIKPSELEIYEAINESNSLQRNIRKYIEELKISDEEIEKIIIEIENIECKGIVECAIISSGYIKIGMILDRKFVKAKHRLLYGNFNSIEVLILAIIIFPLMYLIVKLILK